MSSHSLPSLSPHERPRRQAQLPARYDDFILQYRQQPLPTAETQQPLHSVDMPGTGPHYQPWRKEDSEDDSEESELPMEGGTQEDIPRSPHSHSPVLSERALIPDSEHLYAPPIAPVPDAQTALIQQLIEEVRNQGRLIQQCMFKSSPSPLQLRQQLPSLPVSRTLLTQPVPQPLQFTHPLVMVSCWSHLKYQPRITPCIQLILCQVNPCLVLCLTLLSQQAMCSLPT